MSRDESLARGQLLVEWQKCGSKSSTYGPWLARFAAGLCAKAAAVQLHSPAAPKTEADEALPFNRMAKESLPAKQLDHLSHALETWRLFVLGKVPNPGRHELHLLAVDIELLPGLRGVFGHLYIRCADSAGVLVLLNGVAILGVTQKGSGFVRRSTRIEILQGAVGAHNSDMTESVEKALQQMSGANVATWAVERDFQSSK